MRRHLSGIRGHINKAGPEFIEICRATNEAMAKAMACVHQKKVHAGASVFVNIDEARCFDGYTEMEEWLSMMRKANPLIQIFMYGELRNPLPAEQLARMKKRKEDRQKPRPFRRSQQLVLFGRPF